MKTLHTGERYYLSGDSKDLWINEYNVRVASYCTVQIEAKSWDKKVRVVIDEIDGERDVCCDVKKSALVVKAL